MRSWFEDPELVRQFPPAYRLLAAYCRVAVTRRGNRVPGGSFLQRVVIRLTRRLRLTDRLLVRLDQVGTRVCLDLLDTRILWVLDELRAPSAERRVLHKCLREGDSFIDVGANHGSYALIALQLVGSAGRIIAFEPQPRLAEVVCESLRANGAGNWTVHQLACSDKDGSATFVIPAWQSGSASLFARETDAFALGRTIEVRTAPLDSVIDRSSLGGRVVLKMDVEGSELAALRGARQLIKSCQPTILLEVNPTTAAAAGYGVRTLIGLLSEFGYESFYEVGDTDRRYSADELELTSQRNIVAVYGSGRL